MKLEKFIFTKDDGTEFSLSRVEAEKLYQELKSLFGQSSGFPVFSHNQRLYSTPSSTNSDLCSTNAPAITRSTILPEGREL